MTFLIYINVAFTFQTVEQNIPVKYSFTRAYCYINRKHG